MSLLAAFKTLGLGASEKPARFVLRYSPPDEPAVTVGHLEFDGTSWVFRYHSDYKRRSDLRPIEGFDDKEQEYRSPVLFPFFLVRIPDISRDDVKAKIALHRVRRPDTGDLLRIFGRRAISSPAFELLPA